MALARPHLPSPANNRRAALKQWQQRDADGQRRGGTPGNVPLDDTLPYSVTRSVTRRPAAPAARRAQPPTPRSQPAGTSAAPGARGLEAASASGSATDASADTRSSHARQARLDARPLRIRFTTFLWTAALLLWGWAAGGSQLAHHLRAAWQASPPENSGIVAAGLLLIAVLLPFIVLLLVASMAEIVGYLRHNGFPALLAWAGWDRRQGN